MANVEWAKTFFERVTSTLPDLLTRHGEGKELEAMQELVGELTKEREAANAEKRVKLTEELKSLGGPAPSAPAPALDVAPAGDGSTDQPGASGRGGKRGG